MKHSGLQKSITSIFNSAEPQNQDTVQTTASPVSNPVVSPKPQPAQPTEPSSVGIAASAVSTATVPNIPSGSAVLSCPSNSASGPKPAVRLRPIPKKKTMTSQKTISIGDILKTVKTRLFGGSHKSLDARQKKTAILGLVLVAVFVGVLLFVLGSGPASTKAASKKSQTARSPVASQLAAVENWKQPDVYPASLRDPTKVGFSPSAGSTQHEGTLAVRGIVYSSKKSSAIIADQIVFEGEVVEGIKIAKIEKDFVEFEKDGKRWQQHVGP